MYLFIQACILPVHILIGIRSKRGMIQSGVEIFPDNGVGCLYLYLVQFVIPDVGGFLTDGFEIPAGQFLSQVLGGSVGTYRRDGYLDIEWLRGVGKLVMEFQIFVCIQFQEKGVGTQLAIDILIDLFNLLRKDDVIRDIMVVRPTLCLIRSFDRRIVHEPIFVADQAMPPVRLQDMSEVEHHAPFLRIVVGIFMETYAVGRGQFYIDAEVVEPHGIITRCCFLGFLLKRSDGLDRVFPAIRQQGYVAHIADTRSREVRMAEGVYLPVVIMITTAGIPAHDVCVGTELHHCIRTSSTREGMPMKAGPDKRVGILHQILCRCVFCRCRRTRNRQA